MAELITIDEARRRVLEAARAVGPLPAQEIALDGALGRVLREPVVSGLEVPPFDASAMDGYALVAGPAAELEVVGEARAGHPFEGRVEPGTAIRISTGAPVPAGADAVVPVERIEDAAAGRVGVPETAPGANVRRAGEDIRPGQEVLGAGTEIGPAEAGVLASLGLASVDLPAPAQGGAAPDRRRAGGTRLAAGGGADLRIERRRAARTGRAGRRRTWCSGSTWPTAREATRAALGRALEEADVVCVSGGVSVGPHDHVKDALAELGAEQRFWGVALKPGKPTWFGVRDRTLVFGLPGNPVSAMVTFQLFARPALRALLGADPEPVRGTALLEAPVKLSPRREQAVRVRLSTETDGWRAAPTGPQQSHLLTSMLGAAALALVPRGEGELAAGERVEIELLP